MIHYHGTPISGGTQAQRALKGRHIMLSYATKSNVEQLIELCHSFTLDNGAYTAWKAGTPFDLEGYAEWATHWHKHPAFDWCLIPDEIDGDEDANALMRAKWHNATPQSLRRRSVPVWHLHESLDVLQGFAVAYDRVALGSSGEYATIGTSSWWSRMYEAMDVLCENRQPKVRIHGLRMLDPTIFSQLPFSSADSTNVARNAGLDKRWDGPYCPRSPATRAAVLIERIESHASASLLPEIPVHRNLELFG